MLTADDLRSFVDRYVLTINARDPEAIAALFAADAVQADPASKPANVGRAAIATFFTEGIAASQGWTFRATDVHTCAPTVAFHFEIAVVVGGTTMTIAGIEIFRMDDAGLIDSAHAYWDDADVAVA